MRKVFPCLILLTVLACQTVTPTPTTVMTPSVSASPTETNQPTATRTPFEASPSATGSDFTPTATSSPIPPTQTETPTYLPTFTPDHLEATPTRIAGQTPTGVIEVTPIGGGECPDYPCYHQADIDYAVLRKVCIRQSHAAEGTCTYRYPGDTFHVNCLAEVYPGEWWASTNYCWGPGYHEWSAVIVGGIEYTRAVTGPAGR